MSANMRLEETDLKKPLHVYVAFVQTAPHVSKQMPRKNKMKKTQHVDVLADIAFASPHVSKQRQYFFCYFPTLRMKGR
jgi:hypothetical protein